MLNKQVKAVFEKEKVNNKAHVEIISWSKFTINIFVKTDLAQTSVWIYNYRSTGIKTDKNKREPSFNWFLQYLFVWKTVLCVLMYEFTFVNLWFLSVPF